MSTATVAFDTLAFAEELKAAGIPEEHAKAHAKALSSIFGRQLVSQEYLDARIRELELRIAADLAPLKWGTAITVGGIVTLILKSFFPH
ncbi:MAG: DUF1640 domain-containing protein [Magnetococcales bacterium]|nr:DUF1640 domain-containing protein [Magnetococcales bacterium]